MSAQQYDDGLTPQMLEDLVAEAIRRREFDDAIKALNVLAVRDPHRAEVVYATIRLGLDVAKRRNRPAPVTDTTEEP